MNAYSTLILGIGNTLLSDEGAGIHILNKLQSDHPSLQKTTFIDGGTLSFTLAIYLQDCSNVIVLDAAEFKASPGTVKTLIGPELDKFLGAARRSPHEVGLLDLFDIARLTESLPVNRALIGIQPKSIEWGMSPTPPVEAALGLAVDEVLKLMDIWEEERQQTAQGLPDSRSGVAKTDPTPVITP